MGKSPNEPPKGRREIESKVQKETPGGFEIINKIPGERNKYNT